jgi:XapX domain-containing protein
VNGEMLRIAIGLIVGFLVGAGCRWFNVPAPSPPTLWGAFLVVSMTIGYTVVDRMIAP